MHSFVMSFYQENRVWRASQNVISSTALQDPFLDMVMAFQKFIKLFLETLSHIYTKLSVDGNTTLLKEKM